MFEITVSPVHMPNVLKLIDRCPGVRFILDHLGNPNIKDGEREPWPTHVKALAECTNVYCKVSGAATNADLENWKREDFVPFVETVFDAFGFDRVIYAGDWPHALRAIEYVQWVETLDWLARNRSDRERRKLFRENAIDFYRLDS